MESLLNKVDRVRTIKEVDSHLTSFAKIRHYYTITDSEEGFFIPGSDKESTGSINPSRDKILKQINKTEYINKVTQDYIDNLLKAINSLQPYYRRLLLLKYFYECDNEEMSEIIGFSERKVYKDLKDAKVDLAFLLGCEKYYK